MSWHKIVPRPKHPKEEILKLKKSLKKNFSSVEQINQTRAPEDTRPLLMAADEEKFGPDWGSSLLLVS